MISFLLHLAGAVALLLWSVRMIRTGVERGFMTLLRAGLRRAAETPFSAAVGGAGAAIALQSSTAVAMLACAFAAAGSLAAPAGLALLLGADLGSAVVAQILFYPSEAVIPLLLLIGVTLFMKGTTPRVKQSGRIIIGLALVFVSLAMIRAATAPLAESELVGIVVSYLANDLVSAFLIGGVIAWAMHSSVAAVLTYVTFVAEGLLPVPAAAAMVLGANLGGAAIPVLLTLSAPASARQIVLGNVILRGGGAALALGGLIALPGSLGILGTNGWTQVLNLHLAFNLALAVLALPLAPGLLRLIAPLLPRGGGLGETNRISALDDSVLSDPERALACARREVLRMGEHVHAMLVPVLGLFTDWDPEAADEIMRNERDVDRMHFDTKLYIARLQQGPLSEEMSRQAMDIATAATNLEDAGDRISSSLLGMAKRMKDEGLSFSEDGLRDLKDFHDQVMGNAQLALNVLMTGNPESARQLVAEKERARASEQSLQERHLARLRTGGAASIETSNMHQEVLRALKQINTAFTTIAYPIAEESGDLLSSRLAKRSARNG